MRSFYPSLQTTPNSTFCIAFNIFVVGECRGFKFSVLSQPMDDKLSLETAWSRFFSHPKISLEWLKLENSNSVLWLAM